MKTLIYLSYLDSHIMYHVEWYFKVSAINKLGTFKPNYKNRELLISTSLKWFYHRFYDFEGHKKHQFLYAQPLISAPALYCQRNLFLCNLNIGLLLPDRFCSGLFFAWPILLSGPLHVWIPFYLFKVAISLWTTIL